MKIKSSNVKHHARKIKNATEEELNTLEKEYGKLLENVKAMDTPMLILVSIIGIAIIIFFNSNIFDLLGLIIFVYPFYLFAEREGHQEGFFEGYYEVISKHAKDHE